VTVAKAIVQLVMTVLAGLVPALTAGPLDTAAWVNIVILSAGIVMVYNTANIPGWHYAKFIASAVSAVAVVLASALTGGITGVEVIQMVLAGAAAIGVGAVPNGGAARVQAV
jgi:enoyl-[acyl-carrier-protein] reductase (NADH)